MGSAWHRAGTSGHQQALRVVLAAAAAQAVVPVFAEASAAETAHQALGDHLIEALPVLLGDKDPEEHGRRRQKSSVTERKSKREKRVITKERGWKKEGN